MKHKLFTLLLAMIASTSMLFAANGTCGDNLTWDLTNGVLTISGTGAMTDYTNMSSNLTPWYSSRSSITSVVIGDGVTSIGNYAFYNCNYLSSVNIPNSVTSIGDDVFDRCNNLTSIVIPNSVTSIGSSSFYKCGITVPVYNSHVFAYMPPSYTGAYIIPSGIESIAGAAFSGCSGITSVTIPNSVTSIGHSAFYKCYSLTSVTIPNNVTSIDVSAFSGCSSLTSIIIPSSVTSIGESAFRGCSNLTSVTWNAKKCSNFSYSKAPFYDIRTNITSFVFGSEVEYIPSSLCYEMSNLTSITIPDNVTSIKSSAFSGCSNLTSVIWNAKNCPNFSSNSNAPFYNIRTKITSFVLGSEVEYIPSNLCYEMSNLTSVTIPNSVTSIGNYAFNNCSGLTSVTIGNSVASIGSSAFYGCSGLTSVTIPNKVTSIGSSAFHNCSGLTSVTIGSSIASIGSSAFSGCSNLTSVTWNAKKCSNFSYNTAPFYAAPTKITSFVFGDEVEQIPAYLCNGMSNLTSITIPDNVTSIGSSAFYGCSGLTSVTIPNNVTSIGSSAFYNCSGLTSVTIGNSVTNIESSVFSGCNGLTSVTINSNAIVSKKYSSSSTIGSIFGSQVKEYIIGNSVDSIGDYAFYNCSNLESITLGNNITDIGKSAFLGCSNLTSIVFPNSVKNIGNYAFRNCTNLNAATLGNSVINISEYAFAGCTNLTSIEIPNSIASIGSNAFNGCTGLKSVNLSDMAAWCNISFGDIYANPLSYAHNLCFNGEPINNLVIPAEITQIGDYAFYNCSELTSVEIPNSVTSIGNCAFYACTGSTSIVIPNSVISIGSNAFFDALNINYNGSATGSPWGAKNVNGYVDGYLVFSDASKTTLIYCSTSAQGEIVIPNSVISIESSAFSGCTRLTSVTIPNSVTSIGSRAFYGCTGLTSIEIPNSVTSIGYEAFYNCSGLTSVTIPNSVTSIGSSAFYGCSGLTSVTLNSNTIASKTYTSSSTIGSIFGTQVKEYFIGESVASIGNYAFYNCSGLPSVTIPNSVTSIGNYAFYNCSGLTSVTIPNSVTSIGNNAFSGCSGLTSVTIPNSVTSIGRYAFYGCSRLNKVYWNALNADIPNSFPANLDSLIIGEDVEEVGFPSQLQSHVELRNPMTKVRSHANPKSTSFFDYNHDGVMEFIDTVSYGSYNNNVNVRYKNLFGFYVSEDLLETANLHTFYDNIQTINLNNDTLIDFINGSTLYQANSNRGSDKIELDYTKSVYTDHLFALDADLNGTTDFYSNENGTHYLHLRQFDGSYLKVEMNVISETAEVDSAIYAKWDKQKTGMDAIIIVEDHFPSLRENMFLPNVTNTDNFKTIDVAVDLDKNGLVDLLSTSTGAVLYNLGNNKFLRGKFPGAVTVKDMNNDGVEDFVIYDESTSTVSLQIYSSEGSYQTITLMQNMNISNVWCYDYDNDGDIDILLPFDWTNTSGYSYLVFFRNDGNNTFKKVETAFDDPIKHFQFLDCRDVDNDGKYEIIARDSLYDRGESLKNGNYYLIRYNNRLKATMDAEPFAANTDKYLDKNSPFIYGDFDNDGTNDCYYKKEVEISYNKYYYYAVLSHFANSKINTAPQKMSAPRVAGDAETGKLLVSWDQGSDAESPNIDLVYSLRIGTAPGLGDMWYASALSDGKQTSLNAANVGSHLSQIVNISGWKAGDYYIAVQAIDPNGLGGQWSDEVVYHHALSSATFNTSMREIATADTLLVQYAGVVDNTVSYIWDFGDSAAVLSSEAATQTYKIVYNTAGNKTVSLQIATADGRTSPIYTTDVLVYPMKLEKSIDYYDPNYPSYNYPYYLSYFDMDMDGQMDAFGRAYFNKSDQQGFFKGKADGSFIKLAKTYNTDLTINDYSYLHDSCIFADFNMDGLPDVQWSTSKGTTMYNMEDFDVEFSNETFTIPYTEEKYDFNGDGIDDEVKVKNTYALAIILNGENGEKKDTIELDLPSGYTLQPDHLGRERNPHVYDVDNNGMLDFIVIPQNFDFVGRNIYVIYLNEDWSFYCQDLPYQYYDDFYRTYHYESLWGYPFVDLNNDGTPDFKRGYFMKSRITNEVPAVPTNLRVVQEDEGVYLYWDAAKDKETPAARMRYNISVKKQGVAVGTDNAFVVSPMNGLYDEANIVPGHVYPHGTSYFIPIDKFIGGQTYEFQIQSIDLWNAHSPMSAAYTFTVQPQVLISMPANTCINEPVTVAYTGTNNGSISWNFNGGTASQNNDGTYTVSWATEGVKTVTATLNGNTSSRVIYVQNTQKDLTFALPERVLNNSWVEVTLPENYMNLDNLAARTSDNCTGYVLPKKDSRIFRVCFRGTSSTDSEAGWVEFYQNNPVCGEVNTFRDSTLIVGNGSAPAISLVTVDAATGKNMITWDAPANLPAYVDSVIVYKEEGKTNNWVKQAKVPVSAGQWIDHASDPAIKSYAYCIAYTSVYGGESPKSKAHKTPHLQTNYGLNGAINLYWTYYQGDVVDSYQILRGSSATNMQVFATVAGDECTYTDNSPIENGYYAIAYSNEVFTEEWTISAPAANAPAIKRMPQARQIRNGHSNIMASASSVQATLVEQMTILAMERSVELSPSQNVLHLYVETSPISATFKQVKWEIVSGEGLATINSSGLLVANTEGRNGTVRVRATAIDGSGVYAERDITVGGMVVYYTIRFINWNGEVLQSSQVVGGDMPTYNGATPVRAGEGQYVFSFRGWSPDIVIATADADYIAQYDTTAYYTIRFLNWDGTVLQSGLLKEGSIPAYNGETPTREESETYTYTFKEWEPSIAAVTTNADYTAQYDSVAIQYYTIRFLNWDGTVLQSERLREGTYPEYKGETPTRADDEYYTYTFRAWSPGPTVVTKDADYTAIYYDTMIPHFTIRFLDWDGDVLQRDYLKEGVMPAYRGETPIHEENDYYTYTFKGWEPEIVAVTTDADYIAQYDSVAIPYYTIRFLNWDGTVLQSGLLKEGSTPAYNGETPTREENETYTYTFKEWEPSIAAVTTNADYTAQYDSVAIQYYTIRFLNWDGTVLQSERLREGTYPEYKGETPTRADDEYYTYTFRAWSPGPTVVTKDADYTAIYYDTMIPHFTIRFLDWNGDVLQRDRLKEGVMPIYRGETPIHEENDYYTYTFKGWEPEIVAVTTDADYIAQYDSVAIPYYYTIRFLNWDGTVLQSSQVEEGDMPAYDGTTPVRPEDENYTYSFKGWSPTIVTATENADYTATYTAISKPVSGCVHTDWLTTGESDWGEMYTNNAEVWTWNSRYGAVSTKRGGVTAWLLTPQQDLNEKENITLSFSHVHRYAVDFESEMTLWISADYQGSVESSSWQQLPISPYASNTSWTYVDVVVNVPVDKVGEHTVFGFKYTSTADNYATWEIRNLHLDAQCSEVPTSIENTTQQSTDAVRKVIIGNTIYILRGEKVYTLTGQEVK